jgi:hypothetical protein
MPERRFPPPWSAEVQPNYYVVRDHNGQQLAYVYFEDEPGDARNHAPIHCDFGHRALAQVVLPAS